VEGAEDRLNGARIGRAIRHNSASKIDGVIGALPQILDVFGNRKGHCFHRPSLFTRFLL
jgi:hypothetical protein